MKEVLLSQFDFHHKLYNNVLKDISDEESNRRVHGDKKMNHIKYLAGHLLNSQYGFGFLSGLKLEVKWNDLFAVMGQSKAKDDVEYPSIEEIKKEWNEIYNLIRRQMEQLSTEDLAKIPPKPLDKVFENDPIFDNNVAGFMAFLNHHQAYHIGQIGILRRGLGKEPMSYE